MNVSEVKELAQNAAEEILNKYWQKQRYPVDPFAIAAKLDIKVEHIELTANVAGGIWSKKGYSPVIFVNKSDHLNRKRFTCAHELGHYYLRQGEDEFEFTDYRDTISTEGNDLIEIFANNFAANLLMPAYDVKISESKGATEISVAHEFGVSPEAAHFRLRNLRGGRTN